MTPFSWLIDPGMLFIGVPIIAYYFLQIGVPGVVVGKYRLIAFLPLPFVIWSFFYGDAGYQKELSLYFVSPVWSQTLSCSSYGRMAERRWTENCARDGLRL